MIFNDLTHVVVGETHWGIAETTTPRIAVTVC
jgi:hypothetical protein